MAKDVNIVIGAKDMASRVLSKVSRSMGSMRKESDRTGDSLARLAKRAVGAFAAFKGLQAVSSLPGRFAQATAEIGKLATQTGETVENLSALRFASRSLSVDFDDAVGSIEELNIRLGETVRDGTGPAAAAFQALGIDAQKLAEMAPVERIKEVGDALSRVQSEAQRGFLADEIFGGDAFKIMPLLSADLNKLTNDAKKFGAVVGSENVAAAQRYTQAMVRVKSILANVAASIGQAIAPAVTGLANYFAESGAAILSTVKKLRDRLLRAFVAVNVAFQNVGTVADLVRTKLALAMEQMIQSVKHALTVAIPEYAKWFGRNWTNLIGDAMRGALTGIKNFVTNAGDILKRLWKFVKSGMKGGLKKLGKDIGEIAGRDLLEGFQAETEALPDIADRQMTGYERVMRARIKTLSQTLKKKVDDGFTRMMQDSGEEAGHKLAKGIQVGLKKGIEQQLPKFSIAGVLQSIAGLIPKQVGQSTNGSSGFASTIQASESRLLSRSGQSPVSQTEKNTKQTADGIKLLQGLVRGAIDALQAVESFKVEHVK